LKVFQAKNAQWNNIFVPKGKLIDESGISIHDSNTLLPTVAYRIDHNLEGKVIENVIITIELTAVQIRFAISHLNA
jgi:hypothetical protein